MGSFVQVLGPLTVPAAVTTAVATQQNPNANVAYVIDGTLAAGGIASLTTPRRVTIVSNGDDSASTFSITGTDRNGNAFTELKLGSNASTATSVHDFLTVTRVSASVKPAGLGASIGTSNTASTAPLIVDQQSNPGQFGFLARLVSGAATFGIECSLDDFSPAWDTNNNAPLWFTNPVGLIATAAATPAAAVFSGLSATNNGVINQPLTMIRLTTTAGQGTVSLTILQALGIKRF